MTFKLRLLLTSKCTARCAYCHNEGQSKAENLLSLPLIKRVLDELVLKNRLPEEIVLSGGEPTLHKQLGEIARLCRATGAWVSMDSHGGHPELLAAALPYLDELKLHIDSFDTAQQYASMRIDLQEVLKSVALAKTSGVQLRINHPVKGVAHTQAFVREACERQLDCKLIEMFGQDDVTNLACLDWRQDGYKRQQDGDWLHTATGHRVSGKRCGGQANPLDSLFVSAEGIRRSLDGEIIAPVHAFSVACLDTAPSTSTTPAQRIVQHRKGTPRTSSPASRSL